MFENASIGYVVNTISATDRDQGTNAMVSYILTSGGVPFRLRQSNPGDIFVNGPLNREETPNYILHVNYYGLLPTYYYLLYFIICRLRLQMVFLIVLLML